MTVIDFSRPFPINVIAEIRSGWWRPRDGHPHYGADLFAAKGTPILAVAPGKVIRVQRALGTTAGLWVAVEHANGVVSRYMHMSKIADGIADGVNVRRGQVLGYVGTSGFDANMTGPHLHFDIKAPSPALARVQAEVGKPTTGWGPLQAPWGYAIPVEPWLPVDRYSANTIADAAKHRIPLQSSRSKGGILMLVAGAALVGWGAYKLLR